jgi:Tol biopolymer transport system component
MKVDSVRLGLFLTSLMGFVALLMAQGVYTAPQGDQPLYMPQIGRAEPAPADFLGLAYSQRPTIPQTPLPLSEIYTVRGDGTALNRLTTNELYDESPQWSPDGSLILWQQSEEPFGDPGYHALMLMNSDGSNSRTLSDFPGSDVGIWSPDGNHIFVTVRDFMAEDPLASTDFYMTSPTALTPTLILSDTQGWGALWSPDGGHLAFYTYDAEIEFFDIYRVNADGTGLTRVVEDAAPGAFSWSPDGEWLTYNKEVAGNSDVYITRADGSETRRLTTSPTKEFYSPWVEGGARLLVSREIAEETYVRDIVTIADGTTLPFLPENAVVRGVAPDGQSVLYEFTTTTNDLTYSFHLKSTDGNRDVPLSPEMGCSVLFCGITLTPRAWSADGQQVAYTYYQTDSPDFIYRLAFVASVGDTTPTYHLLLDDEITYGAYWLPYGNWLSAYSSGDDGSTPQLQLFNSRTAARIPLPLSEDGHLLIQSEWRYDGSE